MADEIEIKSKTKSGYKANEVPAGFQHHPFLPVYVCRCKTLSQIINERERLVAASLPRRQGN
jgi:hypothetical protein